MAQEVVGWGLGEVGKETAGPAWPQESDGLVRTLRESLGGLRGVGCVGRGLCRSLQRLRRHQSRLRGSGGQGSGERELTRERQVYLSIVGPRLGDIAAHQTAASAPPRAAPPPYPSRVSSLPPPEVSIAFSAPPETVIDFQISSRERIVRVRPHGAQDREFGSSDEA